MAASLVLATALLVGYIANLRDRKALLETQRQRTERILDVASGDRTKSELAGVGQEEFNPWILGATM